MLKFLKRENMIKEITLYVLTLIIVLYLSINLNHFKESELTVILKPVVYLIEKIFSLKFNFIDEKGFYNESTNVLINKSCSGVNFFILTLLMSVFSFIKRIKINKFGWFLIFLTGAYGLTIMANFSRIAALIFVLKFSEIKIFHLFIGIICYLFYLTSYYTILNKLLSTHSTLIRPLGIFSLTEGEGKKLKQFKKNKKENIYE